MITGFEVWRYYLSVKLHFTSKDYDAVKSGGHVTASQTAYMKRRDKTIFDGLATKFDQPRDAIKYLVANFAYGHNNVIYDREVGQELLKQWIKNKESLSRVFANDLYVIKTYFEKNHIALDQIRTTCIILKLLKANAINIESANLLHQFNPIWLDIWAEMPESKMLYENELLRIRKLSSFINITEMSRKVWNEFKHDVKELNAI